MTVPPAAGLGPDADVLPRASERFDQPPCRTGVTGRLTRLSR
jgi:hypothetical protein